MSDPAPFHFLTTWRVQGTSGEVADVLRDLRDLPRWWPAVCLAAEELEGPGDRGLGQRVRVQCRAWLPRTLRCECRVIESRYPERVVLELRGDMTGQVTWAFAQDGAWVNVTSEWTLRTGAVEATLLDWAAGWAFERNYRWAMQQGEESLAVELLRRRAAGDPARRVPAPPGPVTYAAVGILAGAAVVGGGIGLLVLRQRRRARRRREHVADA